MDPKKFRAFEERVLEAIPSSRPVAVASVARQFAKEPGGYGESDAKAALLGLKAQGRIELDANGNVSRK